MEGRSKADKQAISTTNREVDRMRKYMIDDPERVVSYFEEKASQRGWKWPSYRLDSNIIIGTTGEDLFTEFVGPYWHDEGTGRQFTRREKRNFAMVYVYYASTLDEHQRYYSQLSLPKVEEIVRCCYKDVLEDEYDYIAEKELLIGFLYDRSTAGDRIHADKEKALLHYRQGINYYRNNETLKKSTLLRFASAFLHHYH
jgi:hypothetical protein